LIKCFFSLLFYYGRVSKSSTSRLAHVRGGTISPVFYVWQAHVNGQNGQKSDLGKKLLLYLSQFQYFWMRFEHVLAYTQTLY